MCLCACAKMAASMKTIAQQPGMMAAIIGDDAMPCYVTGFLISGSFVTFDFNYDVI